MTKPPESNAVQEHFQARIRDLEMLYNYSHYDAEILIDFLIQDYGFTHDELEDRPTIEIWGEIEALQTEYGLSFDYVQSDTFEDQPLGYFRYQLSYGGPSEEFRFYVDLEHNLIRSEFWLLDWFTGSKIECTDNKTVQIMWGYLRFNRSSHYAFENAMAED